MDKVSLRAKVTKLKRKTLMRRRRRKVVLFLSHRKKVRMGRWLQFSKKRKGVSPKKI
jgi:hypothetical protein